MKHKSLRSIFIAVLLSGFGIFIGACAPYTTAQTGPCKLGGPSGKDCLVEIKFNSQGCPESAKPENFNIPKAKRIYWQSVDAAGNNSTLNWEIFFDPFKGRPIKSNNGTKQSPNFDTLSPEVEYKYTIVGDNTNCAPLDPRFRLR